MASVKDHYDLHLAEFYGWMSGPFDEAQLQREKFYADLDIRSEQNTLAVDLGCGHGIDTISLSNLGYEVVAIDFNATLLSLLNQRSENRNIHIVHDDLLSFFHHVKSAGLIVCMGDTLTHLDSISDVQSLLKDSFDTLSPGGILVLSFRDYSEDITGTKRFIPVKADDERILTCFLEYEHETVNVTDLLYKREAQGWVLKTSDYKKLRLAPSTVAAMLRSLKFAVEYHKQINGMCFLVAKKK